MTTKSKVPRHVSYVRLSSLVEALDSMCKDMDTWSTRDSEYVKGRKSFCRDVKEWLYAHVGFSFKDLGINHAGDESGAYKDDDG